MKRGRATGVEAEGVELEGENQWGPSQRDICRGGPSRGGNQRGPSQRGRCGGGDCSPHPPFQLAEFIDPVITKKRALFAKTVCPAPSPSNE